MFHRVRFCVCLNFASGGLLTYFWRFCESSPVQSTSIQWLVTPTVNTSDLNKANCNHFKIVNTVNQGVRLKKCGHTTNSTFKVHVATVNEYTCRVAAPNFLIPLHSHRVDCREVLLTPLQATDQGETITMVTASGRNFTQQIHSEDIALQEMNPATPGQLVLGNWSIALKHYKVIQCLVLWHKSPYTLLYPITFLLSNLV